jgi:glycerate dehydrogenase
MGTRIVVLDGHTMNPGDLSWAELEKLGDCEVFERSTPEQALHRSAGAQVVLTNKVVFSREVLQQLPELRYIGVTATGYNVVDTAAARDRGVVVTNVPTYATRSVAQAVFAHVLNLTHHVGQHAEGVRGGRWTASVDFCYWDWPLVELEGLTMGLVGFGRIGRATAELARAFGIHVLAYDQRPDPAAAAAAGVELTGLDDLLARGDVVSLHCPMTPQTQHMVDARWLAKMKPTAFLINTSRGGLVDAAALAEALAAGRIAGAGLDVLEVEPPPAGNPLLTAPNCHITPHVAWATRSARQRLLATVVANVAAFLAGKPINVVS